MTHRVPHPFGAVCSAAALLLVWILVFGLSHAFAAQSQSTLAYPGSKIVDYERYGSFSGIGTEKYAYHVTDEAGLSQAAGEGIPPNDSYSKDPEFHRLNAAGALDGDPWRDHLNSPNPRADFFAWCKASSIEEAERLYFAAEALRRCGEWLQAIKAYHAVIVRHPTRYLWLEDHSSYWYLAPEAIARIRKICAEHPDLGVQLEDAFVDVDRGTNGDPNDDRVRVWPGRFVEKRLETVPRSAFQLTAQRGNGKVRVSKYNDRFWQLEVNGEPFLVKGVTYSCTTVGESAHAANLRPWMRLDDNRNGKNDGLFDSWIDANGNNRRDADEPIVGDAQLLERVGANSIRVYHTVDAQGNYDPAFYDKALMRTLQKNHGIYFIMGDFLGAYTVGSKADWRFGTNYTDPQQRENMKRSVRAMVMDHKDEPYVLIWLLGNENQHPHTHTNAFKKPVEYARFVNEVAQMIHELDPDHPVALCNLGTLGIQELASEAPAVDIYGANVYSGDFCMGSIWQIEKRYLDRPLLFTEMGSDAYRTGRGPDEGAQADYFNQNWTDIETNVAGARGEGTAIGGVVFEWMDEWWKSSKGNSWGDPNKHNIEPDGCAPFADGWANEEWLGIFGQGDGSQSHFLREPRAVYPAMKARWTKVHKG